MCESEAERRARFSAFFKAQRNHQTQHRSYTTHVWLLNARTSTLEDFFESQAPPYAILSHTWGAEEVSFQDIQERQETCKKKKGYEKIIHTCHQALKHGLEYAWIDTCCIDKSSGSELSEAINSMFRWYGKAVACYAFLADVPPGCNPHDHQGPFAKSRWFTRGWTLQELLAPDNLVFYASDWSYIASKNELRRELSLITGVDTRFLSNGATRHVTIDTQSGLGNLLGSVNDSTRRRLHQASVAERMSWASSRQTTRTEDMAYCLLGIFGISMPLIYGEGERAFVRLQEEIIEFSNDQSILAWGYLEPWKSHEDNQSELYAPVQVKEKRMGVLARSPAAFRGCGSIIPSLVDKGNSLPISVTNKGLHICLPVSYGEPPVALLRCRPIDNPTIVLAVNVKHVQGNRYSRADDMVEWVDHRTWSRWPMKEIYLSLDEHLEEELYESEFSYPGSSVFIRHIPDTFSVQELSPHTRDMATSIFPPNHKTISPGLSPCTGNIALLFTSEQKRCNVALYFSLTKLPRMGASPLMMRKETFLMSVPCHLTNSEARHHLYHRSTWKNTSNYIWCGADALYSSVTLQRAA
ncbi:heterokaryon incompatibility protein-domain-containing protein [Aspergillus parasiticus]|uniref:Heterokaryon incompatibility protein-domain-containing protein n=1 Tax=Aspergillus parasiticus TaxID=5067 RepID=A0A5N6D9M3_ASPPA|nr:heterokaryon incompatibility protein-domain-containing protein [Aspergillus parasiticus]